MIWGVWEGKEGIWGVLGRGGDLGKEDEGNWGIGGTVRERKLRIVRE